MTMCPGCRTLDRSWYLGEGKSSFPQYLALLCATVLRIYSVRIIHECVVLSEETMSFMS